MRKLVIVVVMMLAVFTFVGAMDDPAAVSSTVLAQSPVQQIR
jgi:hypothetical protein